MNVSATVFFDEHCVLYWKVCSQLGQKPLLVLLRILDTEATDVHRLLPFFSHSLSDVQAMLDSDHAIVLGLQVLKVAYSMPSTTQVQRPAGQQDITPLSLRKLACEFLEKMVRNNSSVAVVLFREVFCTGTYQKAFLTEGKEDEALFSVLTTMFHANVDLCMTVVCNCNTTNYPLMRRFGMLADGCSWSRGTSGWF